MANNEPMVYLRENYPGLAAKAGQCFIGWMHRMAFPNAPIQFDDDPAEGCMVLYAPTQVFPEALTLGDLRRHVTSSSAALARADDSIVDGARADGVELNRDEFDPQAWAVIPDFDWPRLEKEATKAPN